MAIDFPNSPSSGDIYTVSGKQWSWDGEKWLAYGASLAPDILKIDTANNRVGINQTTPTVALDVTGAARITGDLTVSGTTVTVDAATVLAKDRIVFEGATADSYETTLLATDPTADRTLTLPDSTGTLALTGATPTTITVADTTDTTTFVGLWESATGDLAPKSDAGITYNAGTGTLTATAFAGPVTGNVTGNASGTSGSTTGNAATATALATARTIGGVSFDGTANIAVGLAATATALATARTIGGTSFDGTANITPANATLAATATALATGRTINGVSFDGTANITVVDSAALPLAGGTLSGEIVAADQVISAPVMKDYAETVYAGGNSGTSQTLALTNGNVQTWTMNGNCTFTMPSGSTLQAGSSFTLILTQDGTGSRTGTFTGVKWAGGTAPTLTTTATSGIDILTFTTFNGGASPVWHGFFAGAAMA